MRVRRWVTAGGRRGVIALALAAALTLGGGGALAWAGTHQTHAPQPSPSAAGRIAPLPRPATGTAPSTPTAPPPPVTAATTVTPPARVSIPAIGVDSPLQYLGLNRDGTLQTPRPGPHYNQAAWFDHSAIPGQPGVSVILGHIDSAADGPSVFFRLGALRPGDQVFVTLREGLRLTFTIDGVRRYPKSSFPTAQVYGGDPTEAALRLITCGGAFDQHTGNYLANIVVYAHLTGVSG